VNESSFSYEKVGTKTRFERDDKSSSEMDYWTVHIPCHAPLIDQCVNLQEQQSYFVPSITFLELAWHVDNFC